MQPGDQPQWGRKRGVLYSQRHSERSCTERTWVGALESRNCTKRPAYGLIVPVGSHPNLNVTRLNSSAQSSLYYLTG